MRPSLSTQWRAASVRHAGKRADSEGRFTVRDMLPGAWVLLITEDNNRDGWPDVFVANDTMMNQLWINVDGTRFVDEALLRGCALDEHGMTKAGMGVDSVDVDELVSELLELVHEIQRNRPERAG